MRVLFALSILFFILTGIILLVKDCEQMDSKLLSCEARLDRCYEDVHLILVKGANNVRND
jgi:hypothetical protein